MTIDVELCEKALHELAGLLRQERDLRERFRTCQERRDARQTVFGSIGEYAAYQALWDILVANHDRLLEELQVAGRDVRNAVANLPEGFPVRVWLRVDTDYVYVLSVNMGDATIILAPQLAEALEKERLG